MLIDVSLERSKELGGSEMTFFCRCICQETGLGIVSKHCKKGKTRVKMASAHKLVFRSNLQSAWTSTIINLSMTSSYPRMESNFSTCGGHPYVVWSRAMSDMNPSYTYTFAHRERKSIRTQRKNCDLSEYDFKNYFTTVSIYLYFPPSSQLLYLCFCPVGLSLL